MPPLPELLVIADKDKRGWLGRPVYRGTKSAPVPETNTRGSNIPFGFKPPSIQMPEERRTKDEES